MWVASDHVTSNAHIWRLAYRIIRQSEVIIDNIPQGRIINHDRVNLKINHISYNFW